MATIIDRNDMLNRRVRKGWSRDTADEILSDVLTRHGGENLVYALVVEDFATELQARRYVEAHDLQ